jgi:hypothetical protein
MTDLATVKHELSTAELDRVAGGIIIIGGLPSWCSNLRLRSTGSLSIRSRSRHAFFHSHSAADAGAGRPAGSPVVEPPCEETTAGRHPVVVRALNPALLPCGPAGVAATTINVKRLARAGSHAAPGDLMRAVPSL